MEAFSPAVGSKLCWVQPRTFERQFELRAEKGLYGMLSFATPLGRRATAEVRLNNGSRSRGCCYVESSVCEVITPSTYRMVNFP